ncbi:hypothetical protein MTO98_11075 [Mucilaginibacter sp. SMC90]|uniref:hypothetical protein n=1 Tax=Mucilaginibacter sp. SMC90 TaxID=2929803 RepID=UPI001FB4D2DA|nr:hypothetical protein [Mucilaginibacter sp. SMC90]UOE51620.1 hypothetical protein MTO98_11075 [Mucilaginibacter sp. SMC90]
MTAIITRINYLNIVAMLASAVFALFIPFELVLLSYAILGPLHYLTEISWLNTRQFFTLKQYDYLLIAGVVIVSLVLRIPSANLVYYTFGLSFILLVINTNLYRFFAFLLLIAMGYFLLSNNILRTIFGLYIPTLIHVYIFTGAFLLLGALKHKGASGYIAFITFLICPLLLSLLFNNMHNVPTQWAIHSYEHFARINTTTLRNQTINIYTNTASIILTRTIAFAYTYHYINWFSKTKVINWHRVSKVNALMILLLWVASVSLYFYNYRMGIKWLFILSLAHVILEFPLNHRSFIDIGKQLQQKLPSAK